MCAADEVHELQRELLEFHARKTQLLQPQAQISRVLYVKGQLRPGEQDQPPKVGPQQRRHHERKPRVDNGEAGGVNHEGGEHLANRGPQHPAHDCAGQRRAPVHACVGDHHVRGGEKRRYHHVGRQRDAGAARLQQPSEIGDPIQMLAGRHGDIQRGGDPRHAGDVSVRHRVLEPDHAGFL